MGANGRGEGTEDKYRGRRSRTGGRTGGGPIRLSVQQSRGPTNEVADERTGVDDTDWGRVSRGGRGHRQGLLRATVVVLSYSET